MNIDMMHASIAIELAGQMLKEKYPEASLAKAGATPVDENSPLWDVCFIQTYPKYYTVRVDVSSCL